MCLPKLKNRCSIIYIWRGLYHSVLKPGPARRVDPADPGLRPVRVEAKTRSGVGPVKPGRPGGSTRDPGHPVKPGWDPVYFFLDWLMLNDVVLAFVLKAKTTKNNEAELGILITKQT